MSKEVKKASNFVFKIITGTLRPILYLNNFRFDYSTSKNITQPCVILSNHQSNYDQYAIAEGFNFAYNMVASDSLVRNKFLNFLYKLTLRTIPFSKGSSDSMAIRGMMSVIKQGGTVAMFPSGNRSFFGEECTQRPGVGKLVKKLNVPVVLVKMQGGYSKKPRWKNTSNRGPIRMGVCRTISPEELQTLTAAQLEDIIKNELYTNEFEWNAKERIEFRGKQKAEYLESVLFYCPQCKNTGGLSSSGNEFFCTCGMRVLINSFGFFDKIQNADNCPDTILDWSKLQLEYIKSVDYSQYIDTPLFTDENVEFLQVTRTMEEKVLGKGTIALYGDRITVCDKTFPVKEIKDIAIMYQYRLTIYTDAGTFFVVLPKRGNPMKYMVGGYHIRNLATGCSDEFYGY